MHRNRNGIARGKRIMLLLVISILCFGAVLINNVIKNRMAASPEVFKDRLMGTYVVEDDQCVQGKVLRPAEGNPDICMEGVLLPADKEGTLYLPQTAGDTWTGRLAAADRESTICILYDELLEDRTEAIRSGKEFTLWCVREDSYTEYKLVITGLPIIELVEEEAVEPEEVDFYEDPEAYTFDFVTVSYGKFKLFNPGVNTQKYEIIESNVKYHIKGGITRGFKKKGYALSLLNHNGKNLNTSLLGMREDNSWKLNALFTDSSRVREKSAIDLWADFADQADGFVETGARAEYTELIVNGTYMGIYALVEPIDEKKLALDANDILYKSTGEIIPTEEEYQEAVDNEWKFEVSFRVIYPDEPVDYARAWFPIHDYTNRFFSDGEIGFAHVAGANADDAAHIDLNNIIDNHIYLMAIAANDNSFKNTYFYAKEDMRGNYVMYRVPWDMDYSFGNYYLWDGHNHTDFNPDYTVNGDVEYSPDNILQYGLREFAELMETDPENVGAALLQRWEACRKDFLSDENVRSILQGNCDRLKESGAYVRERERWPKEGVEEDIEDLLEYEMNRLNWLDGYFAQMKQ